MNQEQIDELKKLPNQPNESQTSLQLSKSEQWNRHHENDALNTLSGGVPFTNGIKQMHSHHQEQIHHKPHHYQESDKKNDFSI